MLKVIVADDEAWVCKLVLMIVDWDALGMKVIGTAANGLEALELVESLKPDILITDIRMPGIDGLELIEKAKAIAPDLQIALISGYAQFEYARTAINFDVGGYILKPINKEIITATLVKLGNRCREKTAAATAAERLLQDSHKSSEILRSRLIEDLLSRHIAEPSRELLESKYGFAAAEGPLLVFIIKIDCSYTLIRDPSMDVVKKKVEEIFEAAVAPLCEAHVFQMSLSAGYGILNFKTEKQTQIRRALRECLNQLEAHRFGGLEFSLGIGKAAERAVQLPASMQEARIAVAERIVEGTGRILEADFRASPDGYRKFGEKYVRAMERAADNLNEEEADGVVAGMADEVQNAGMHGYALFDLVINAGKALTQRLSMEEDAPALREFEERCELCGSAGKLFECLRAFLGEQIGAVRGRLESEAIRPIRIAKQYVAQHFNEPITLDGVCAAAGFSVSYFSKMFKQETGEGFSKYLARVRIDKAKELLRDTNLPVAQVCGMVGYSDIKHFTGTFKNLTSLKPSQYRKLYG